MDNTIKIALVGTGMFGGDVHARAYADLQRAGISPQLGRVGLDKWARDLAPIKFELAAVAARTEKSARRARDNFRRWTGHAPRAFAGARPWLDILRQFPDLDVLAVATPDPLHAEVILAALKAGVHVITEKPMCLHIAEADRIIELARRKQRIVTVDMHKRYDADHMRIREEIRQRIGDPLYGAAYLEEPLHVSTRTFKWAEESDPFSYVGTHWVDLIYHYYRSKPVSLTAVGQKKRLLRDGINAYDAVQVRVDFANGMSISFHNNWITPPDFEGPVNQGHEIVGTDGKVESDQQYRGLRWWSRGGGSRTANSHFTRDVKRTDGSLAYIGYGIDSLTVGLAAICRVKFFGATRASVADFYPTAEEARISVAIIHAARVVRDLNFRYLRAGKGAPVTARFGRDGITIVDPCRLARGKQMLQRIYDKAL
ncbi:MAG TPA: Gfo/Idh/MocA family oxidoreductase [Candidatus Paceibacterota bacterium]|nr:Gfo/Idh/MocA family oxidoreductase [Verrucomicrobiota bacterium]HSA11717.1 Gfo/Idh/MocA family oxidoreductase [Candidatus Paceibacterota bacterium]